MSNISKKQQVIDFAKATGIVRPSDLARLGLPRDYLYCEIVDEKITQRQLGYNIDLLAWPTSNQKTGENLSKGNKPVATLQAPTLYNRNALIPIVGSHEK